jgi:TonB family protein
MAEESYQPQINLTALDPDAKQRWVVRMLFTMAVLGAVAVVVVYHSWFRTLVPGVSNDASVSTSETAETSAQTGQTKSRRSGTRHRADSVVPTSTDGAELASAPGVSQAALRSPLAVEVISGGGQHQMVSTQDTSLNLNLNNADSAGVVELASPAAGSSPLVAKQMGVEGAVVLLARIDKDGNIQNLQIVSGPEILFAAAREAVKQWRFKPHSDLGQATSTETQITVKFAISAH